MNKDFVTDQNPTPIFYADGHKGLPSYAMESEVLTADSLTGLNKCAFADQINRLHPLHTKAAALLSGIYVAGTLGVDSPEYAAIKQAAVAHGISDDLESYEGLFTESTEKSASSYDDADNFAITVEGLRGENSIDAFYPIANEAQLTKSAVEMVNDYQEGKLPVDWFKAASVATVKRAAELQVPDNALPVQVVRTGTPRLANFDNAEAMIETRKWAGVNDEGLEVYRDVVKAAAADRAGDVDKYVDLWVDMDTQLGVKYSSYVPNPYDAFFAGEKVASVESFASNHLILEDVLVPAYAFNQLSETAITRNFDKEAAAIILGAQDVLTKSAAEPNAVAGVVSNKLASLDVEDRKELLRVMLEVEKKNSTTSR